MPDIDLTPFGFTPTESRVYEVLLRNGPGTGYTIARSAGLARANTYSALEGLVSKGAALVEGGRPKRYRPENPAAVIARITSQQGQDLDRLSTTLSGFGAAASPTLVEVTSPKGALQIMSHEIARAHESVQLLVPVDAYPILAPALRRVASAALPLDLLAPAPVELGFAPVVVAGSQDWPGEPLLMIVDRRAALIGARRGAEVEGHWSTAAGFVAAGRCTFQGWPRP
jgi:sugar-specific transcriptional regulator TrmB